MIEHLLEANFRLRVLVRLQTQQGPGLQAVQIQKGRVFGQTAVARLELPVSRPAIAVERENQLRPQGLRLDRVIHPVFEGSMVRDAGHRVLQIDGKVLGGAGGLIGLGGSIHHAPGLEIVNRPVVALGGQVVLLVDVVGVERAGITGEHGQPADRDGPLFRVVLGAFVTGRNDFAVFRVQRDADVARRDAALNAGKIRAGLTVPVEQEFHAVRAQSVPVVLIVPGFVQGQGGGAGALVQDVERV